VALMFFEDSLRTRIGFEAAAARLGFATVAVSEAKQAAQMAVPETFVDTVRCVGAYCDGICLRHPDPGAPELAASLVSTPVLNCGNGTEEHPTQALIDLFAIHELRGAIDGLRVTIVGDLRHMRTAHSLLVALGQYEDVRVRCVSPAGLTMPDAYTEVFSRRGNSLETTDVPRLEDADIIYFAGLPRTPGNGLTRADQARYRLDGAMVEQLDAGTRVLCPLPRVDEIAPEVDDAFHAAYFEQNALGLPMRMAILERALAAGVRAPLEQTVGLGVRTPPITARRIASAARR
jgi:aspartate carbamoyltransferase